MGAADLAWGGAARTCQGQESAGAQASRQPRAGRLKVEHPHHVRALDSCNDATDDGRELKFLNVVDEFNREALAIEVDRSINAEETVAVLRASLPSAALPPTYARIMALG